MNSYRRLLPTVHTPNDNPYFRHTSEVVAEFYEEKGLRPGTRIELAIDELEVLTARVLARVARDFPRSGIKTDGVTRNGIETMIRHMLNGEKFNLMRWLTRLTKAMEN